MKQLRPPRSGRPQSVVDVNYFFFFFLVVWGLDRFGVAVADHVEAHEVGGSGLGAGAGDDADDLTVTDVA